MSGMAGHPKVIRWHFHISVGKPAVLATFKGTGCKCRCLQVLSFSGRPQPQLGANRTSKSDRRRWHLRQWKRSQTHAN